VPRHSEPAARMLYTGHLVEAAIRGCLANTMLGPHERTPSWEGEDIFSVCDILPLPKSPTNPLLHDGAAALVPPRPRVLPGTRLGLASHTPATGQ
jgi:hypothetical protein